MMRKRDFFLTFCMLMGVVQPLLAKRFDVNHLVKGGNITLNSTIGVSVVSGTKVALSPTDMPQSLRLHSRDGNVELTIYDRHAETTRKIILKRGVETLYTFSDLTAIALHSGHGKRPLRFSIDSNKPLKITRLQ